jgi:hypothetical protein
LRDQYGNVVAGRSPDRNPNLMRSYIETPRSNDTPFIIPGISPTPTQVVYTNYPRFGDGQPISAETLILPGGQPFVPSPSVFLNGSQSLPNFNISNLGQAIGSEQSPVRQGIADFIKVGSGVIPGTSYGITNDNYQNYKLAKEESDRLSDLEFRNRNR